jgi:hypothetical protein
MHCQPGLRRPSLPVLIGTTTGHRGMLYPHKDDAANYAGMALSLAARD